MSTNTKLSIEIAYRITTFLNHQIETHGETKINNREIWHGFLHQMNNEVWDGILKLWEELSQQHPELFQNFHLANIAEARKILDTYSPYYDNVLDMKNKHLDHKKVAWKLLMSTREIWNRCCDIYLPNSDKSKVLNSFSEFLTVEED